MATKAPATRKGSPAAKAAEGMTAPKIIKPGDNDFQALATRGGGGVGRPDTVSPVMNPIIQEMLDDGVMRFQIAADDPFSVGQIRNWARKRSHPDDDAGENGGNVFPTLGKIKVGGGKDGQNIQITLVEGEKSYPKPKPRKAKNTDAVVDDDDDDIIVDDDDD